MTASEALAERTWRVANLVAGTLLVVGLGLVGVGSYFHFTVAAQVRAGHCDGCEPWHPLIVLAPLVVGAAFVLLGGYLLKR